MPHSQDDFQPRHHIGVVVLVDGLLWLDAVHYAVQHLKKDKFRLLGIHPYIYICIYLCVCACIWYVYIYLLYTVYIHIYLQYIQYIQFIYVCNWAGFRIASWFHHVLLRTIFRLRQGPDLLLHIGVLLGLGTKIRSSAEELGIVDPGKSPFW